MMDFEWGEAKYASNLRKHGVGFRGASRVFNEPMMIRKDTRRDYGEDRFIAGGAYDGLIVKIIYTQRGNRVRIISAWRASRHEARAYRAIHG